MESREIIAKEIHSRLNSVSGTLIVFRNPKIEPTIDDIPCISFFELGDRVIKVSMRGGVPYYLRQFNLIVEPMIKGTTEGKSTPELIAYVKQVKQKIYEGGPTLGGTCDQIVEVDTSSIIRPPLGENVAAIGMSFNITYKEDIRTYFT